MRIKWQPKNETLNHEEPTATKKKKEQQQQIVKRGKPSAFGTLFYFTMTIFSLTGYGS